MAGQPGDGASESTPSATTFLPKRRTLNKKMETRQPLRYQLSAALWQLERELLVDVCRRLKCSGLDSGEPHSKTKRTLIMLAEGMFDEIEKKVRRRIEWNGCVKIWSHTSRD